MMGLLVGTHISLSYKRSISISSPCDYPSTSPIYLDIYSILYFNHLGLFLSLLWGKILNFLFITPSIRSSGRWWVLVCSRSQPSVSSTTYDWWQISTPTDIVTTNTKSWLDIQTWTLLSMFVRFLVRRLKKINNFIWYSYNRKCRYYPCYVPLLFLWLWF